MVVQKEDAADRVFAALADGTRRDIVRRTLISEQSVSTLAGRYEMSFAAVQKHVAVLERAGLVVKRRSGREQLVGADIEAVRVARRQLEGLEALWRGRLERFGDLLEHDLSEQVQHDPRPEEQT